MVSRHHNSYRRRGFTLVELIISTLLMAMIAVAVGLATQYTRQRSGRARLTLIQEQSQRDLLRQLTVELGHTCNLQTYGANTVVFDTNLVGQGQITVQYVWSSETHTLQRRQDGGPFVVIAENLQYFDLQPDVEINGDTHYLRGWRLSLQIDTDPTGRIHRYIDVLDPPVVTGI